MLLLGLTAVTGPGTGSGTRPDSLAVAGGTLRFGYGNDRYRIRGHCTPPAKGAQTAGVWSRRTYLTVRPGSPS